MAESFDAFRYVRYMRSRGLWIGASCGVACALALVLTLAQPRQYTATTRMVIEPPAGTDLHSAMAVSPIYLESLKTYEVFASGDTLFRKAMEKFGLRNGTRAVESLKKRVLKVEILRNTRIMEISATLPDPHTAQALAQFLAESTVEMNHSVVGANDEELIQRIENQAAGVRARLDKLDSVWSRLLATEPVDELSRQQENAAMLRANLEEQIVNADVRAAEAGQSVPHSRAEELRRQVAVIDRETAAREKILAERTARRDNLEQERGIAQAAETAIEGKLREVRSDAGYRGERLKIIDPGIVPERPSAPNLPLNLMAALLLGLVLPILYFTLEMSWQEQRTTSRRTVFHTLAKTRDE